MSSVNIKKIRCFKKYWLISGWAFAHAVVAQLGTWYFATRSRISITMLARLCLRARNLWIHYKNSSVHHIKAISLYLCTPSRRSLWKSNCFFESQIKPARILFSSRTQTNWMLYQREHQKVRRILVYDQLLPKEGIIKYSLKIRNCIKRKRRNIVLCFSFFSPSWNWQLVCGIKGCTRSFEFSCFR